MQDYLGESKQFRAIDNAFGSVPFQKSLSLITLLRLSPVLPFAWANYVFGLSFLFVRVVLYWAGVYHAVIIMRPTLLEPPYACNAAVLNTVCFFITAGAILNGHWMVGILKMASRGGSKAKRRGE